MGEEKLILEKVYIYIKSFVLKLLSKVDDDVPRAGRDPGVDSIYSLQDIPDGWGGGRDTRRSHSSISSSRIVQWETENWRGEYEDDIILIIIKNNN